MEQVHILTDWLVSAKSVRGTVGVGAASKWLSESARPRAFDPKTRIVTLEDGQRFSLPLKNASQAKDMHKRGEKILQELPVVFAGPYVRFISNDFFSEVKDEQQLPPTQGGLK